MTHEFPQIGVRTMRVNGRRLADDDGLPDLILIAFEDVTARREIDVAARRLEEERAEAAKRQKALLREILHGVTGGRLRLCDSDADLPAKLTEQGPPMPLPSPAATQRLRRRLTAVAEEGGFPTERMHDMETAVAEAAMNAVLHGGGGEARICADADRSRLQVWIVDEGVGIPENTLHKATLERGFSTAATLEHGFWLMLHTCDCVYLCTGESGTTIVLEKEKTPLPPPTAAQLMDDVALTGW